MGVLAVPALWMSYCLVWLVVIAPIQFRHGRSQIVKADRAELLAACRDMITNKERYKIDGSNVSMSTDGDISISWIYMSDDSKDRINIPLIIRNMDPKRITISKDQVDVDVGGPPRLGFIGYTEGNDKLELLTNKNYKIGFIMLTNGLWYY